MRDVAEMLIGHARSGLLQVYDRYEFLNEKREGVERHGAFVRDLVDPE
jgi:hypothetical protein